MRAGCEGGRDRLHLLGLTGVGIVPSDCADWLLGREADGPVNVFKSSKCMFRMLTGREPPFEAALDWLQFAFIADCAGAYVAHVSMVLAQSAVAEGG